MQNTQEATNSSNRNWKSSAFTTYFGTKERAAELYQVLTPGREAICPDEIEFTTLEGVLFMARKNDLAFTAGHKVLVISEHQSTVNLNMPLRNAIYYGRTMEKLIPPNSVFRRKRIMIPAPEFYVFYNGTDPRPLEETLLISDAYLEKTDIPMLELRTKVININLPEGHDILRQSRSMYEYSWFVQRIREHMEHENRDVAIAHAIRDCLNENIMVDFITQYGHEVNNMLFQEFDLDKAREVWREEDFEDGREAGLAEGRKAGLAEGKINLIEKVIKKLHKGQSTEVIADALEEDISVIQSICDIAPACEYDAERIHNALYEDNAGTA